MVYTDSCSKRKPEATARVNPPGFVGDSDLPRKSTTARCLAPTTSVPRAQNASQRLVFRADRAHAAFSGSSTSLFLPLSR